MTALGGTILRDPFACCVELRRFGAWQAAVGFLTISALTALALWGSSVPAEVLAAAPWIAGLASFAIVGLSLLLFQVDAGTLQREAGRWTFAPIVAGRGGEPKAGELVVALDLGRFMLLVFTARHDAGVPGPRRWLPAQKAGLESDWQALRCAVHAPRPSIAAVPAPSE